jgi:hypothetical protein
MHVVPYEGDTLCTRELSPPNATAMGSVICDSCVKEITGYYVRKYSRSGMCNKLTVVDCCICLEDDYDVCIDCAIADKTCNHALHLGFIPDH